MPSDLTFTIMSHAGEWLDRLKSTIGQIVAGQSLSLSYQAIDYDTGWSDFMRNVIYGSNQDVSEMGTSWVNDFAAMNGLRPFSPAEVRNLGGEAAFPPGLWRSGVNTDGIAHAIPWMTYLSLVYYRRDLLREAGVEVADAFSTPENLEQTLERLSRHGGMVSPWAISSRSKYTTLHDLSMWLWAKGTDFVGPTGKDVLLNERNARSAMRAYFGLARYLSPKARGLTDLEVDDLFARGEAAVTVSGPGLYSMCKTNNLDVGVAIPFGQSIIGGSSLVIWRSTRSWEKALRLISVLSSQEIQTSLPKIAGMLPGRLDMLERFQFSDDSEINSVVARAIQTGRSVPRVSLLGMIEERLAKAFENLWTSLLSTPQPDLDQLLEQMVTPVVERVNLALAH